MAGKSGTKQASMAGFETEDVLYLLPLVTLLNGMTPFIVAASIGAPLFAVWVVVDYQRALRRSRRHAERQTTPMARSRFAGRSMNTTCRFNLIRARIWRQSAERTSIDGSRRNLTAHLEHRPRQRQMREAARGFRRSGRVPVPGRFSAARGDRAAGRRAHARSTQP